MSFVTINNTSIKLSNIKNFGISSKSVEYASVYLMEKKKIKESKRGKGIRAAFNGVLLIANIVDGTSDYFRRYKYELVSLTPHIKLPSNEYEIDTYYLKNEDGSISKKTSVDDDTFRDDNTKFCEFSFKTTKYLYITTFQNDNYRFHESQIDVEKEHQKLKYLL